MASNVFTVNVYNINDTPIYKNGTPVSMGFPTTSCSFLPTQSGTLSGGGVPLYGIITTKPTGLQVNSTNYAVVETVAALKTLINT